MSIVWAVKRFEKTFISKWYYKNSNGISILACALRGYEIRIAIYLIHNGVDVNNGGDEYGSSALMLMLACSHW